MQQSLKLTRYSTMLAIMVLMAMSDFSLAAQVSTIPQLQSASQDSKSAQLSTSNGIEGTSAADALTCNLWSQPVSSSNGGNAYASQDFETEYDGYDIYIADDFIATHSWAIDTLFVPGGLWNNGTTLANASALHFQIYRDNGGKPDGDPKGTGKAPLWSLSVPPADSRITLETGTQGNMGNVILKLSSPVRLSPGTYWLVFYPQLDFTVGGQYGRNVADTTNLSHAQVENPGGNFGIPTSWSDAQTVWGFPQSDFAFCLQGKEIFPWTLFIPSTTHQH